MLCVFFFLLQQSTTDSLPRFILTTPSILFTHNQSKWIQNIAMNVLDMLL